MTNKDNIETTAVIESIDVEERYWLEKLSGELKKSNFPYDNNKAVSGLYTKSLKFKFDSDIYEKLNKLSNNSYPRLHIILITGLTILLNKYTNNNDIILGTSIYNQDVEADFINTILILRNNIKEDTLFKELLLQVRSIATEAEENQNYPVDTILQKLKIPYAKGDTFPLFDVLILLENIQDASYIQDINCNVVFSFFKDENYLEGTVNYNASFYEEKTILRIISHYQEVFRKAFTNLNIPVADLDILSADERKQILYDFNNTKADYPKNKTIHELFEEQVLKTPKNTALEYKGDKLSYEKLNSRSNQVANHLQKLGVSTNSIVGIMLESSFDLIAGILGILKAGAAYLPIDISYPQKRKEFIISDSKLDILLSDDQLIKDKEKNLQNISIENLLNINDLFDNEENCDNPERTAKPSDISYLIYTSGSTGNPKGTAIKHQGLTNYIYWAAQMYDVPGRMNFPLYSSVSFDLTVTSIYTPLVTGNKIIIYNENNINETLEKIFQNEDIGVVKLTPAHLSVLDTLKVDNFKVKKLIVGGDQLTVNTAAKINEKINGIELYNEYGPTETVVGCMIYKYNPETDKGINVPIGKPISNVSIYILDNQLKPVCNGVSGELFIGGDGLALGYINNPGLSKAKFIDNPFTEGESLYRTGDLARRLPDGNIEFLGRIDDQVKIRGYRIELGEIEHVLQKHENIQKTVVLVREESVDKYLCAYVVPRGEFNQDEISGYLSTNLPEYMVPAYFVEMDELPLTINGKVDKKSLPSPEMNASHEYVAPSNNTEEKLAEIWSEIIDIPQEEISVNANFFTIGGHSLKATILVGRIHKEFDVEIPLHDVFLYSTIKEQADQIKQCTKKDFVSIPKAKEQANYRLSSAQKRLYLLQQFDLASTAYNMPYIIPLEIEADKEKIEEVFKQLINRHESFRTSIKIVDEVPVQIISKEVEFEIEEIRIEKPKIENTRNKFIKPFDLSKAPFLRVAIVDIKGENSLLMIDMHHIISDGTTHEILEKEFKALLSGEELAPLSLQYKDYSQWQNSKEQQELLKDQEKYWLNKFEGEIPVLNLPTDYIRPLMQSYEGAMVSFVLSKEETKELRFFTEENDLTLYMSLLSAFSILLWKLSGQDDIIVGTPIAGRNHTDLENIAGMFINTLCLRNEVKGETSIREFVSGLKQTVLGAYENQNYQFEDLVEKLSVERDTGRNPIFDVMINLLNQADYNGDLPEFNNREQVHKIGVSKFDLTLTAVDYGEQLKLSFDYCTKLFKPETIERYIKYFKQVISQLDEGLNKKLSEITILTDEEKKWLLQEVNSTDKKFSEKPVIRLMEDQLCKAPDRIAVSFKKELLTYKCLHLYADSLASILQKQGIEKGSIVPVFIDHSIELIVSIISVMKLGAVFVPIDVHWPAERINRIISDLNCDLILIDSKSKTISRSIKIKKLEINLSKLTYASRKQSLKVAPIDPLYIIYTSGSTGLPKGVIVPNIGISNRFDWMNSYFGVSQHETVLHTTRYVYDSVVWQFFWPLINGGKTVIQDTENNLDIDILTNTIAIKNITLMDFVPSVFNTIVDELSKAKKYFNRIKHLKNIVLGGEEISSTHALKFKKLFPEITITNLYGPTEASIGCVYEKVTQVKNEKIPIGKPISNVRIYIVDKNNNLVPAGVSGEICIAGINLATGYLNDYDKTSSVFVSNLKDTNQIVYKTGDIGRYLNDGRIDFIGRKDNQLKIRGFRIELGEIERVLQKHESINECVVLAIGENNDKYLCAYMVKEGDFSHEELRTFLSKSLPDYMVPSYFVELDKLPLTSGGKVNRKALPVPQINAGDNYVAPTNEIEEKLVKIWSEVLNVPQEEISTTASFFALGGHSLKATILVSKIHKELKVKLPLKEVFQQQTIKKMAVSLSEVSKISYSSISFVEKKEYYALSSAQKRLYFIQQMDFQSLSYNMPMVIPLGSDIKTANLEKTFIDLVSRHESFRTSFITINNEPVQRVYDKVDFKLDHKETTSENLEKDINEYIKPFDLSKDILIRACLMNVPNGQNVLVVDMHHIISDGTTSNIVRDDFLKLFNGETLKPLKLQYKDFSNWQNNLIAKGGLKSQERYWKNLFAGDIPVLNLQTDFKRPESFTYKGDICRFSLNEEESSLLKGLGKEMGSTLYMNILAVLNTLFYRFSNQEDIIIGSGIAGRPHSDLQGISGMFVNTLAMRNYPNGDKIYLDFLKEVSGNCIAAFENQDVQFEDLVDMLDLDRDISRNPVFDINMVVQNFNDISGDQKEDNIITEEDSTQRSNFYRGTSKFDMIFFVSETLNTINISIEYYSDIFKRETIEKYIRCFKSIVNSVIKNPKIKLKEIEILSQEEKQQLLYEFNDTQSDYPKDKTIQELFEEQVDKAPYNIALVSDRENITYKELDNRANQIAQYLRLECEVSANECVGIYMDRGINVIISILGVLKAGCGYLPLSVSYPEERLMFMINDTSTRVIISEKRYVKEMNKLQWECSSFRTYLCLDSYNIYGEQETQSKLNDRKLWEYVGDESVDEVTGGGWNSSYTGQPIPQVEMDEYGDNVLKKLEPLISPQTRILEIGCASGISMFRLAPKVALYYGTDLSGTILQKNEERIKAEGHSNIIQKRLPADEIDQIDARDFDIVIINSVIQCFDGHNYLKKVIRKAIDLMKPEGLMFLGDIMDQDLKGELLKGFKEFKQTNTNKEYKTKTDWSEELFLSRGFWDDLKCEESFIEKIESSPKIFTIENELTRYRYDVLISINKNNQETISVKSKNKLQHDLNILGKYSIDRLPKINTSENVAYIIYTSGSTGKPKGTLIKHYSVSRVVLNTNYISLVPEDTILQLSDYAFDGSVFDIYGALLNGSKLLMIEKNDILSLDKLSTIIRKKEISVFFITTALFNALVDYNLESLTNIRKILFGGERVSVYHANQALKKLGKDKIIHVYGPTETTVYASYYYINDVDENQETIPIGKPISNTSLYVLDKSNKLVPKGSPGELYVGGDGLSCGYLDNQELTENKFIPNHYKKEEILYKTGDLVRMLPDGNIEFIGRIDNQVKIRGFRIELGEIEKVLLKHGNIKECVVIDREDKGEKYLCAYIVCDGEMNQDSLRDYLSGLFADYMIPSYFVELPELPLNANGKVDRKALPSPEVKAGDDYVAPANELEEKLLKIWSEVLHIPREEISTTESFFAIGGHSLKATILVSKIHKELSVKIPLKEIFRQQTIKNMAVCISEISKVNYSSVNLAEKKEYYALSSAQKRMYFIQQMDLQSLSYNVPMVIYPGSDINTESLEKAFAALVSRHESFRTTFITVNNEPVQRVHDKVDFKLDKKQTTRENLEKDINDYIRPFDLSKDILLRACLMHVPDGQNVLVLDMHHIIADGTSGNIVRDDFLKIFDGEKIPPLKLQYKDFSTWQNTLIEKGGLKSQENYWKEVFSGDIPVLNLRTDYKRPESFTFKGDTCEFSLDQDETLLLRDLCKETGSTLYMNILAVLNTLFYRFSNQEDIIISSGIAGRQHSDLQGIAGMFVNTLAMRNYPNGDKTYLDFLKEVSGNSIAAFENQDIQFEDLVDMLNIERDISRNPLFDISMLVQNFGEIAEENKTKRKTQPENQSQISTAIEGTTKCDMTFFITERSKTINISIEYYRDIFRRETIEEYIKCFRYIIKSIIKSPEIKLKDIDLLSEEEKHKLLYEFNDTQLDYPKNKTIHELFEEQVDKTPGEIALICDSEELTYKELEERSNQVAHYLRLECGVDANECIGIYMDNGTKLIVTILGILKSGCAYLPLPAAGSHPEERVRYMINDASLRVIISEKQYLKEMNKFQWECPSLGTYLCLDSYNITNELEAKSGVNDRALWEYIGEESVDEVTGGGWTSSYTGKPMPQAEMDEFGENILKKLEPHINSQTRILEIGCASGISMFRLAPKVELYYGTDLSGTILKKNEERINSGGHSNIIQKRLSADEIDQLEVKDFDIVIINSVIQGFDGHNYLKSVIRKVIGLLKPKGLLFLGDIMDLDLKKDLVKEVKEFKRLNTNSDYNSKTEWNEELFLSRKFWDDLKYEETSIEGIDFSQKIHTIENELTKFRYDVLISIDKNQAENIPVKQKNKHQHDLKIVDNYPVNRLPKINSPESLVNIIYTSGSTGKPKGVQVKNSGIVNYIMWRLHNYSFTSQDVTLQLLSNQFDGFGSNLYSSLLSGGTLVLIPEENRLNIEYISEVIKNKNITNFSVTPGIYSAILDEIKIENHLNKLRFVVLAGEKANYETIDKSQSKLPNTLLYNEYGPTEASIAITCNKGLDSNSLEQIGKPISNTNIYILGEGNNMSPILSNGELCVSGAGLAFGYLNNPELTTEKFIDHPFIEGEKLYRTGDKARWLSNGNIEFLGRIDHQVKIRGFRVELGEIENVLLKHENIKECAVTDIEENNDKSICAYVVCKEENSHKELRDYMLSQLPEYMVPSYFIELENLPLNANGKVNRKALPSPKIKAGGDYVAPSNETEEKLVEIWSEVLNVPHEEISTTTSFFAIGGHSLKATILVSKIHKELSVKFPLKEIFRQQTIKNMAVYISKDSKVNYSSIKIEEKREYHALSSAQKRLYFIQQLDLQSLSYNMPMVIPLGTDIKTDNLENAFVGLVGRHESFRTSFITLNNVPVQRVYDQVDFKLDKKETTREKLEKDIKEYIRPFDLSKDILIRACLMNVSNGHDVLVVDMHHIISDGTTGNIVKEDFLKLFNGEKIAPLKLQYKDFSKWQNNLIEKGGLKSQERYWKNLFSGDIPVLNLQTDYKRPESFTFNGGMYRFSLDEEETSLLRGLGKEMGSTLYMNILAVLNTLFYRFSNQEDIIIGSGIAGRQHSDLQGISGMFVNTLAMRNYPTGDKTYLDFLEEVSGNSIAAFENQDVQFEDLVDMLNIERDISRNPVFDINMVVQNFGEISDDQEVEDAGERPEQFPELDVTGNTSKFDMTFYVSETVHKIDFLIEYYADIFKRETIEKYIRCFKSIVSSVIKNPTVKLKEIEILSQEEKQQLLYEFNDTQSDYPKDKTIHKLFEEQVDKAPGNIALVSGKEEITYKELDNRSNQIAHYLRNECEVSINECIGIFMDTGANVIISILGILKAGCGYLPLSASYPEERIKFMINDTSARVVISEKQYVKQVNKLQWECPSFKTYLCLDSFNVSGEQETQNRLNDRKLWEYVGAESEDAITGGGWTSSYTGQPIPQEEMDEYSDNVLKKLEPHLTPETRILEIGCASGISMFKLAPKVALYYGTDLSGTILQKNQERINAEGHNNIIQKRLSAHEIDQVDEKGFDIVIINSVIQCFDGHNYLKKVIHKAIDLMKPEGVMFFGDIMDQDLKNELLISLEEFKRNNTNKEYSTKTDLSEELFLSRGFWNDLKFDEASIKNVDPTRKIYTLENELTKYRYDVLISIDKNQEETVSDKNRNKFQHDLSTLGNYPTERLSQAYSPDNLAYIIYTSGSTGGPKGVVIEHSSVVNFIHSMYKDFKGSFSAIDNCLSLTRFAFDVSVAEYFLPLSFGSNLVLFDYKQVSDIELLAKTIIEHGITFTYVPPSLLNSLYEKLETQAEKVKLNKMLVGVEPISHKTLEKYFSLNKEFRIINGYGPTEATICATRYLCDSGNDSNTIVPIGRGLSNNKIYLLDYSNKLVPIGGAGEICISGTGLSKGYLNNPGLTREKFIDHPFKEGERLYRTGDLARWLPDGNIEFLGRIDHQVKIRGYRIEMGEIESTLLKHENIKESVVHAIEKNNEKYLCAYVVCKQELNHEDLRAYMSSQLPDYMAPSYYVELESLPLTANGKINRKALPSPEVIAGDDYTAPSNEIEEKLVEIWSEVLNVEKEELSVNADFFTLGGHSLKATILISKINDKFNVTIPLAEIFKSPTIRILSKFIIDIETDSLDMQDENLVLLRKGNNEENNLFLIHAGSGEVDGYINFCNELNDGFNYWGIKTSRIENYSPINITIEEIASKYIEKIKIIQPEGPYNIAGWCIGGTIAFEMIKQLEQKEEEVKFCALINASPPSIKDSHIEPNFSANTELELISESKLISDESIKEKMNNLSSSDQIWPALIKYVESNEVDSDAVRKLIPESIVSAIPDFENLNIQDLIYYFNTVRSYDRARNAFVPETKNRTFVNFFSADKAEIPNRTDWNKYCHQPIKFHKLTGDHFSIFKSPEVIEFAKKFEEALRDSN